MTWRRRSYGESDHFTHNRCQEPATSARIPATTSWNPRTEGYNAALPVLGILAVSRSLSPRQAAVLGFVVLVALSLGAVGVFGVGQRQRLWSRPFTLEVGFARVPGVAVGTPVRVRGLDAGVVAAVALPPAELPDAPLVLRLRLDRSFQPLVFADARAAILSEGMVGSRVIEITPGSPASGPAAEGARIAAEATPDLADLLKQTKDVLSDVRDGQGTLGKLLKDDRAYTALVSAVDQARFMMQSSQQAAEAVKQDAEAVKRLPLIRGYVEDATALLIRPVHEKHRHVVASAELFEPGRAVLTDAGRERLNAIGAWVNEFTQKGSDVVVAAFADPKVETNSAVAKAVTQKQAEAVCEYLRGNYKIHKLSLLRWRDAKSLGLGTDPPPVLETGLPPARVEVIVFVPQT